MADFRARVPESLLNQLVGATSRGPLSTATEGLTSGIAQATQLTEAVEGMREKRRMREERMRLASEIRGVVNSPDFANANAETKGLLGIVTQSDPIQGLKVFSEMEAQKTAKEQFDTEAGLREKQIGVQEEANVIREKIGKDQFTLGILELMKGKEGPISPIEKKLGEKISEELVEKGAVDESKAKFLQDRGIPMKRKGRGLLWTVVDPLNLMETTKIKKRKFEYGQDEIKTKGAGKVKPAQASETDLVKPAFVSDSDWNAATPEQKKALLLNVGR